MKDLSQSNKKVLLREIEFAVGKMKSSNNIDEVLFFFSAIHAVMQRIFNIEFNSELVFAHYVLQQVHLSLIQRIAAIKAGELIIPITDEHMISIIETSTDLLTRLTKNEDINPILKKLSLIAYSTSGNGYYLKSKGELTY